MAAELGARPDFTCILLRMGELVSLHEGQIAHLIARRLVERVGSIVAVPSEAEFGAGLGRLIPFTEALVADIPGHKHLVIIDEFDDLEDTYLMYKVRDFDLITVSANMPDEKDGVLRMLQKKRATSKNLLFASSETEALQKAFDPAWESAVPYTILLDANGKVLYKNLGTVDILELRRTILANMPSDYIGFNQYWQSGSAKSAPATTGGR